MNVLRSALLWVWWGVTVSLWSSVALPASVFMRGVPLFRLCTSWLIVAMSGARVIMGIRNRVTGQEHVPSSPAVFLVKHQSAWETLVLPRLVSQPLSFVFKREILFIPFFGWALGRMDMIYFDRSHRTAAYARLLRQGKQFLSQGYGVVMFPEGTRMARGVRGNYQSGGARLAIGAGVPVVPVAVASARCWPKGWIKRPGVIDISFGPPIASAGKRPEELMRQAADWIETEMRRIDPQAYPDLPASEEKDAVTDGAATPVPDAMTEAAALAPLPSPGAAPVPEHSGR